MEDQDKEEPWSLRCLSGNVILNRELIVSLCKTSNFHFFAVGIRSHGTAGRMS